MASANKQSKNKQKPQPGKKVNCMRHLICSEQLKFKTNLLLV